MGPVLLSDRSVVRSTKKQSQIAIFGEWRGQTGAA